jgi:hypothetical protein
MLLSAAAPFFKQSQKLLSMMTYTSLDSQDTAVETTNLKKYQRVQLVDLDLPQRNQYLLIEFGKIPFPDTIYITEIKDFIRQVYVDDIPCEFSSKFDAIYELITHIDGQLNFIFS